MNQEDRVWFQDLLCDKMKAAFSIPFENVVKSDSLIYGDFMVPNADVKIYGEVTDYEKVKLEISNFVLVNRLTSHL